MKVGQVGFWPNEASGEKVICFGGVLSNVYKETKHLAN